MKEIIIKCDRCGKIINKKNVIFTVKFYVMDCLMEKKETMVWDSCEDCFDLFKKEYNVGRKL